MTKILAYPRDDGSYGIRNKILILSTVGCANETAARIASQVEGAVCIPNTKGCGQIGRSVDIMRRTLVGLAANPNVFGTVVVGLGCETMQPHAVYEDIKKRIARPLAVLTIQEMGGTTRAIAEGVRTARRMSEAMSRLCREAAPLGAIVLATNCGGSDATSGIAANPALGAAADRIVAEGGTVLLGETTELIGTEHILARRAKTERVREDILRIVRGLEGDFRALGVDVRGANPTPGNMLGGLSTLEEKALGGITKGGASPICEVVPYGVCPKERGLVIMDTPGYDIESVTGMAAGGAQLCAFTSGRGTPVGNPILPVLKITGNRETFARMSDNIDLDMSPIAAAEMSVAAGGAIIFDRLVEVCRGVYTKAEAYGFGEISVYRNYEVWCNHC